jgi:hypothetical protein
VRAWLHLMTVIALLLATGYLWASAFIDDITFTEGLVRFGAGYGLLKWGDDSTKRATVR